MSCHKATVVITGRAHCFHDNIYIMLISVFRGSIITTYISRKVTMELVKVAGLSHLSKGAPFTKCISRINNTDIDNAHDIDIVMPMYNLIEYSDNYSNTSGSLWQYYKDDPNDNLANSKSFKSKVKITGETPNNGNTKDVEIIVPLKCLSNFWRTLEMPLLNCEVNLILTWSKDCVVTNSTGEGKFAITETKLYVLVVTSSTKDNEKLLQRLESGFKKTTSWNKYESSINTFAQNRYLNYLINPSFQNITLLWDLNFKSWGHSFAVLGAHCCCSIIVVTFHVE